MSPSKKTGIQAPLNVSDQLAKIIGTAKGEQVSRPQVFSILRLTTRYTSLTFGLLIGSEEAVGLFEEEQLAGPRSEAVVHS